MTATDQTRAPAGKCPMGEMFTRDHRTDFSLDSPEFNAEYHDVLDYLVEKHPVASSTEGTGYYVLSRYADVRKAAQDWEHFSSADGYLPNRNPLTPPIYPDECDPPYQTRWRRALDYYLSPRVVRSYRAKVEAHADYLIDQFVEDGEVDLVADFASALPSRVWFNSFLGLPIEDLPPLLDATAAALVGPLEGRPEGWGALFGYLGGHMRAREGKEPQKDLIGAVVAGVELDEGLNWELGGGIEGVEYRIGAPAPWEHKVGALSNVTAGGLGTATYLITGIAEYLATHPEQRRRLIEDPELRPKAVEEFIRAYASVVAMTRTVRGEVTIGDHTFVDGDRVVLLYAAACRDPEMYADPGEVDIDRDLSVNAAFGFGPHRCIGSHLARLLGAVALDKMLERLPEIRLAEGHAPHYATSVTREVTGVRIAFTPGEKLNAPAEALL